MLSNLDTNVELYSYVTFQKHSREMLCMTQRNRSLLKLKKKKKRKVHTTIKTKQRKHDMYSEQCVKYDG